MSLKEFQVQDGLLTVTRSDEENRVCLALDGELDLSNTPTLEAALAEAIASEKKVLIDLGQLEFLDSTGISLLVSTLSRQDAERFSFLPSRSQSVARLLELTGLSRRMVISTETAEDRPTLPAV
jgi:anti-sigma B factor antagonist